MCKSGWIPLVQLAWRTRAVVGTIAVVLEAQAGRWPSPIIIGVFIALSYLMPVCRGAWDRRLTVAAEPQAAEFGFAGPRESLLARDHRDRTSR